MAGSVETSGDSTRDRSRFDGEARPLVEVDNLTVTFAGSKLGWLSPGGKKTWAVQDASFDIRPGETLGLVGESGSGKSTIARAIMHTIKPASGSVRVGDFDVTGFGRSIPRAYRRYVQLIMQESAGSLNPAMTVGQILAQPKWSMKGESAEHRLQRAGDLLVRVGLRRRDLQHYPYEYSGGQRQRIAIARALIGEPKVLILDEPVSNLDVPTQNQVINLLERLQDELALTYLFIAHDLAMVRHVADRIAVMYHSRIVEIGPSDRIHDDPQHPYTKLLLSTAARPEQDPVVQPAQRLDLSTDDELGPWSSIPHYGCPFVTRCPQAFAPCSTSFPEPVALGDDGSGDGDGRASQGTVMCHLFTETGSGRDASGEGWARPG